MSIIKLQKGQAVHFTVTSVVPEVPSTNPKYGPSTKFVGHTPDDPDACIFLTPSSAERQLGRLNLTLDSVVGQTVEFAKPGDYVDINRIPDGNARPAVAAPAPVAAAPAPTNGKQPFTSGPHIPGMDPEPLASAETVKTEQWKRLLALHKKCLQFVLETEAPMMTGADVGGSPESVSALTAQLFIAATSAGLHR